MTVVLYRAHPSLVLLLQSILIAASHVAILSMKRMLLITEVVRLHRMPLHIALLAVHCVILRMIALETVGFLESGLSMGSVIRILIRQHELTIAARWHIGVILK